MEIIGESAHQLLAYVEAVTRQGHALTSDELSAYADGRVRKVSYSSSRPNRGLAAAVEELRRTASASFGLADVVKVEESHVDYLVRVRWLRISDGFVEITPLGKAVLREANAPLPPSDVGSTLEVVIDPENPFAYAQLMSRIASYEQCMIVDPYLDQDQLLTLATFPTVTRILTSNKHSRKNKPVFSIVLGSAHHLEVRMAPEKELHDRIVIPSEGRGLMLGSSLNSITRRFGVATPVEERTTRLIRGEYDKIWAAAEVVPRKTGDPKSGLALEGKATSGTAGSESPELPGDDLGDK